MKILFRERIMEVDPSDVCMLLTSELTEFDDELYDILAAQISDDEFKELKENNPRIIVEYLRKNSIPFVYGDSLLNSRLSEFKGYRLISNEEINPLESKFEVKPYLTSYNENGFPINYEEITIL